MVSVGTTTTVIITLSNLGGSVLTVSELTFTGSGDFTLNSAAPGVPISIAPGASVDVPVDYTPSVPTAVSAVLWIGSDDPDEGIRSVQFHGTGIECNLSVNPLALDFGVVPVGSTQTLATTLTNIGNADCTVSALSVSGSADFALNAGAPVPPLTVAPGMTVSVPVDYSSSDFVDDVGTLTIASNDPDAPQVVVNLTGVPPASTCDLEVSPVALDFGAVAKGTTRTLITTLHNRGSGDCSVTLPLSGSADFALASTAPATPLTLAFGDTVDIPVTYTPSDVGADSGTLEVTSNDPANGVISVTLTGTGLGVPDIDITPTALAFGTVRLGVSTTLTTTIANLGDADLTVTELVITGSTDFSVSATAPFTVASGASVAVSVVYTPSVPWAVNAVLWVASDDPDESVRSVALSGTGLGDPDIDVAPLTLDFGTATIGTPTTQSVTISNIGSHDLVVSDLAITGSNEFAVSATVPPLPFTVAPNAMVSVPLEYTPVDQGTDTATLEISSDDPDESVVAVTLSGAGTPPVFECDINIVSGTLDYGLVEVGTTQTRTVTIGNAGNLDCTVSGLTLTGTDFALNATAPVPPFMIAPGTSVGVAVDYTPSAVGGSSGTLEITSDDPNNGVVTVALTGTGRSSGAFLEPPHSDLPHPADQDVCYACHVNRTRAEQQAVSTEICLQCHSSTLGTDPTLVPQPVLATPANVHASTITGTTKFQYDIKCTECHNPHKHSAYNGWQQIKYVKDMLNIPSLQVTDFTQNPAQTLIKSIGSYVHFTNETEFDYVDPADPYIRGICNVCHTLTDHHRNDTMAAVAPGDLDANGNYVGHNNGTRCTDCHTHVGGFAPTGGTPAAPHDTQSFVDNCNFCHVDDGAGNIDFAAAIPDSKCEQCHTPTGSLKSSFPTAPDVLTHSDVNGTGKYTYNYGCVDCHNPMFQQTNIKGIRSTLAGSVVPGSNVVFTALSGSDSFADGPPFNENVCETCHTQTNHHRYDGSAPADSDQSGNYIGHNDGSDCTTCHAHANAFVPTLTPPPPPHDGFDCAVCHTVDATGNLLDAVVGAQIDNTKCNGCHAPGSPDAANGGSDIKVDTHYSDTYSDPTTRQLVSLNCVECHNPMRDQVNFRGQTNLAFIRSDIRGNPVAFEALTGPYSFAADSAMPADMSAANYVCNTCHTQTNHHQSDGTAPGGQSHNDGADCTACHTHDSGFTPGLGGPHPQATTDCSICHLNQETQEADLQGIHNNQCDLCHVSGFDGTFLGPLGTWNGECSACHNPNVSETGNLATPTKGHRCVVCHGQQQTISDVESIHKKHTDKANCVVCHGFIPDVGTEIGSGNREICHLCHGSAYDGTAVTDLHKKMVPKGVSCLECHGDTRPPVDVFPGTPVGNATVVCDICHTDKNPDEFLSNSEGLHKKHVGKGLDCGFCHADANLQDDRDPMPPLDDSRRALVDRSGQYTECAFCHPGGRSADATTVHKKHVNKMWQWCYNCHDGSDQRPVGLVPPVTQPSEACVMCHSGRQYNDTFPFNIHKKHEKKAKVKCYACHQTSPQFSDWPEAWLAP
jgi:hypothetical protein